MRNIGKRQPRPLLLPNERAVAPTEDAFSDYPIVRRMLAISTAHVRLVDADFLNESKTWRYGLYVTAHRYGWYIQFDPEALDKTRLPTTIRDVLDCAVAHDCFFVNLDADYPELLDLPTYDWDDERL